MDSIKLDSLQRMNHRNIDINLNYIDIFM